MLTRGKKSDRQKMIDKLDVLFSEYIRRRAMKVASGCQRCMTSKRSYQDLQAAHCDGRGNLTVRFDVRNALGLCGGCHMFIDAHPAEKELLFRKALGDEDYEALYVLSHMSSKQSPVDLKLKEIELRELLKEL